MAAREELGKRKPARKPEFHLPADGLFKKLGLDGKTSQAQVVLAEGLVCALGPDAGPVYGVVADTRGDFHDLEAALDTGAPTGWMIRERTDPAEVEKLMERFREVRASKFNAHPGDFREDELPLAAGTLVVSGESPDDAAPVPGMDRMVRDALDEHPTDPVYLFRAGPVAFPPWVNQEPRVRLLPQDLSPAACFRFCRDVYVEASPIGLEALIHGCRVRCYAAGFYAGRGLTDDRVDTPPRAGKTGLRSLFEAAYLQYTHYFDPDSGEPCDLARILDHLELQRAIARQDAGIRVTVGWAPWKRSLAEDFFHTPATDLRHAKLLPEAVGLVKTTPNGKLLLWGGADAPDDPEIPVVRVEDGFLRSSGLGAKFHRPLSWVADTQGIYFDPRTPSALETLLETGDFTATEMADARELLKFLREHRLTKYNVGGNDIAWDRGQAGERKVILVPGQVEADASIRCGSPELKSNDALLRRVREAEPDAFLIFKAHPDLVAAARHGQVLPQGADELADLTVTHGNVLDWLDLCDEVHTMTSTLGFESILRDKPVVTYGLPFYAGWGLTRDQLSCPRRTRRLTLEELVCGALIRYPRYLNPRSGEYTTAIQVARMLASGSLAGEDRTWYLRIGSMLKNGWVKLARHGNPT